MGNKLAPPLTPPWPPSCSASSSFSSGPINSDQSGRCWSSAATLLEILQIAGAVLQADDARMRQRVPDRFEFIGDLGQRRHVVEVERQRQFGHQMIELFLQLGLALGHVIRRRDHHARARRNRRRQRAMFTDSTNAVSVMPTSTGTRLLHLAANALNQFAPQTVAQARALRRWCQE